MTIIIDYDNDAVRIGSDYAFSNGDESKITTVRQLKNMRQVGELLIEVVNALCQHESANINVSLMKQDDGEITTIEVAYYANLEDNTKYSLGYIRYDTGAELTEIVSALNDEVLLKLGEDS